MVGVNFFGNFDLASLSIWLFWIFFAAADLLSADREHARRLSARERGRHSPRRTRARSRCRSPRPSSCPHGRGEVTVPSAENEARTAAPIWRWRAPPCPKASPMRPTGDPMVDGVGPASWAPRRDEPELDGHGHPKIVPMASA